MPKPVIADAAGTLPARYRRLLIDQQTGVNGVWDYDFSVHNATPFAGLENGIANCYTNSLWQVLHFMPDLRRAESGVPSQLDATISLFAGQLHVHAGSTQAILRTAPQADACMATDRRGPCSSSPEQQNGGVEACRAAVLAHAVEVDKEFCLTCELGFLFRMLHDAKGSVCQVCQRDTHRTLRSMLAVSCETRAGDCVVACVARRLPPRTRADRLLHNRQIEYARGVEQNSTEFIRGAQVSLAGEQPDPGAAAEPGGGGAGALGGPVAAQRRAAGHRGQRHQGDCALVVTESCCPVTALIASQEC